MTGINLLQLILAKTVKREGLIHSVPACPVMESGYTICLTRDEFHHLQLDLQQSAGRNQRTGAIHPPGIPHQRFVIRGSRLKEKN